MEFDELVENETFRAVIGSEKLAVYQGVGGDEAMWEDFERESENVLTLFAVHSSPIDFNGWHGFYVWHWSDTGEIGVSDDLESFFGKYPFENWSACEGEIRSEKISLEILKKIARKLLPDDDDEIQINGSLLKRQGGELVEVIA